MENYWLNSVLFIVPVAVLVIVLAIFTLLSIWYTYKKMVHKQILYPKALYDVLKKIIIPLLIFITFYSLSLFLKYQPVLRFLRIGKILVSLWIIWKITTILYDYIDKKLKGIESNAAKVIFEMLGNGIRISVFLLTVNILLFEMGLIGVSGHYLEKIFKIILIITFSWVFYRLVTISEKIILENYINSQTPSISARKIKTQAAILKRIILSIGLVTSIASIFLIFESVRDFGLGLLTTAGIISAVGAFAMQQSLMRLFSGLQIAFSQLVRIGDTVIINSEFGTIEDVSLSYLIVKTWDFRRLILPTDYVMKNGLQNLSRTSTQLLGTIFFYVDYGLPVDEVRKKFLDYITQSALWDKNIAILQVTDMKETTMELRCVLSADNADNLWNLRCEIREKLIDYMTHTFPEYLPRKRILLEGKHSTRDSFDSFSNELKRS